MLLQVQGLTKTFGGLRALDDVSLSVEEGTIHGLMGANGAGKTTLFSLIAGNQAPTAGSILFQGRRIDGLSPDHICRAGIARTFQIVRPFAGLSVRQNVETGALFGRVPRLGARAQAALVDEILHDCGLGALADRQAASLTLSIASPTLTRPRTTLSTARSEPMPTSNQHSTIRSCQRDKLSPMTPQRQS